MPSDFSVPVVELRNVRRHPNADRLDLADALGYQVVLPRGKYRDGDLAVYFPVDAELPDTWIDRFGCREFMRGPGRNRVGCAKLRGETSFGLVAEIPDGVSWKAGQDVSGFYGASKHQPPACPVTGDIAAYDPEIDPYADPYTKIRNGRLARETFAPGETVVATEKIHGTNCRIGVVGKNMFAASMNHRRKFPELANKSVFKELFDYPEVARSTYWFPWTIEECRNLIFYLGRKHRTVILYGEVYGSGIQKMAYGLDNGYRGFLAFDLKLDGKFLGWGKFQCLCAQCGVPTVPEVYRGPFDPARIMVFADGDSWVSKGRQIREGVVVRLPTDELRGGERPIFKYIGDNYLLGRKDGDDTTDA